MQTRADISLTVGSTTIELTGWTKPETNMLRLHFKECGDTEFTPNLDQVKEILKALKKERAAARQTPRCLPHAALIQIIVKEMEYLRDMMQTLP